MVALAGALLPGGQRVAVEDPAAALAGLEAASLDGEGVRELAPAVGEEDPMAAPKASGPPRARSSMSRSPTTEREVASGRRR